jgi:RNA polymerase sigma-70 factor (ECF subfamily)
MPGQASDTAATDPVDPLYAAVPAARSGDEQAFRVVYREVHPRLLRYLRGMVGDAAEDVASETWLHIATGLRDFDGDAAGFRRWAATIARHRALDHVRRERRRPAVPSPIEALTQHADGRDTPTEALDGVANKRALALVRSLPADQAEAVLLRVVMGLEPRDAARVLGKRSGAVRTAAYRGLRRLAALVEPPEPTRDVRAITEPSVTPWPDAALNEMT